MNFMILSKQKVKDKNTFFVYRTTVTTGVYVREVLLLHQHANLREID